MSGCEAGPLNSSTGISKIYDSTNGKVPTGRDKFPSKVALTHTTQCLQGGAHICYSEFDSELQWLGFNVNISPDYVVWHHLVTVAFMSIGISLGWRKQIHKVVPPSYVGL